MNTGSARRSVVARSIPENGCKHECFPSFCHDPTPADQELVSQINLAEYSDCSDQPNHADADVVGSFHKASRRRRNHHQGSLELGPQAQCGVFVMQSTTSQFDLLGRLIEASETRQRVISNNITNGSTPNYRRLDVNFEAQLAQELEGHGIGKAMPKIVETQGLKTKADGNNVDVELEMGQLEKNAMLQQAYIQLLGSHLEQMRLAIQGS